MILIVLVLIGAGCNENCDNLNITDPNFGVFIGFDNAVDRSHEENLQSMKEFKQTFGVGGENIRVGFTEMIRPIAEDAYGYEKDYRLNPERLNKIFQLSVETNTPFAIILLATQSGSGRGGGDLLDYLKQSPENVMWYADDTVSSDLGDGYEDFTFLSLSPYTEQVWYYRERNIREVAILLSQFNDEYPDLFAGITTSAESSFPRKNENGLAGYEPGMVEAFQEQYGFGPPRREGANHWDLWIKFRQQVVTDYVQSEVYWFWWAGIPKEKIYTHQVLPDWKPGRVETGSTWDAVVANKSNAGVAVYKYGEGQWFQCHNYKEVYHHNKGIGWAVSAGNPCANNDYDRASSFLWDAYLNGAGMIIPGGWEPYKDSLVFAELCDIRIQDTEFETALIDFIKDLE